MVYIDLLVIEDFIFNYIILMAVSILLNRKTKFKKIFLSSVIGLIPLIFLFMDINKMFLLVIIFIFGVMMSIISFKYKDIIYTFKNVIYMYLVSIFLGGSIYLMKINFLYKVNSELLYVIVLILIVPIITYCYIKSISSIKNNYSNYYLIDIYIKDKPILTINTYLDTGNNLFDPYSHKPVILIDRKLIKLTNEHTLLVPYNTIDNHGLITCFKPEKIYIHKIGYRNKVLIGLVNQINIEGADGILNKNLLERI